MKKRTMIERLNREFTDLTPDVSEKLINTPIASKNLGAKIAAAPRRHSPFYFRGITAAVAALAVTVGIVAAALALLPQSVPSGGYLQNDTFISLSVNPSLSVIADSNGKVVEITTKNRDAEILLAGTDKTALVGRDYGDIIGYLTEEAVTLGYFATANGMSVAAVSCGGDDKTADIVGKIRSGAESVLAESGIAASVTVSALDRGGVLTAAGRIDPHLKGDEDLEDLLEVLARDTGYIKKFVGEIAALFGDTADESVQLLYRMELFDDYADLLEDRNEFLLDLSEFNAELAENDTVTAAYASNSGNFTRPDGWWLSWYTDENKESEELKEFSEEFAELFEDYEEYELDGLEPLLRGNKPNTEAAAKLSAYLSFCDAVDFDELEDYVDELEDLLDDLNETNYEKITAEFSELLTKLENLGADWNDFLTARGNVDGVEDYLKKTKDNFIRIYNAKKAASGCP